MKIIEGISKSGIILMLLPIVLGIVFIITVKLDLYLFAQNKLGPRQAVGNESLVFFFGFIFSVIQFSILVISAIQKKWQTALLNLMSILLFCILFTIGIIQGAAMMYAA